MLDVGCGTGIVSRLFVSAGCEVTGVEPDERMAAVARRHGLAVELAPFEAWDRRGRTFDLLVSGQAWHWVDPVAGAAKAAEVLRSGGRAGLFWNQGRLDSSLQAEFEDLYRRLAPGLDDHSILLGNTIDDRFAAASDGLRATGSFDEPVLSSYGWRRRYTTAEWLDQLPTHSDHRTLPPDQLSSLLRAVGGVIDAAGGSLELDYRAWLVSAVRR